MKKFFTIFTVIISVICIFNSVSAQQMNHWANIRDESYNIIGRVEAGEEVTVGEVDSNDSSRTWITTSDGVRGTVSTVYIYGGSQNDYNDPWSYEGADATGWDSITYNDDRVIEIMFLGDSVAGEANNDEFSYSGSGEFSLEVSDGVLYFYHNGDLVVSMEVVMR